LKPSMSSDQVPSSWFDSLPASMDEAFMVDWIDGAVDETRACEMARAAGRADLIDRVRAMRGDRALLRADVEMPASGLRFEDVLRRLDVDASMRIGGASSGDRVRSGGDGHASAWREPRSHRRAMPAWPFAMAAGVVLAAWVGVATVRSGGASAVSEWRSPVASAPVIAEEVAPPMTLAASKVSVEPASAAPVLPMVAMSMASRLVTDSTKAAELAKQGRLLLRVAVNEPTVDALRIDSTVSGDFGWKVSREVSEGMLAALAPFFASDAGVTPDSAVGPNEGRFLASEMYGPEVPSVGMPMAEAAADQATVHATYIVRVDKDAKWLDRVKQAMNRRLGANVLCEELPAPVKGSGATDSGMVVPVIVERH
jgi:hypothetical protein